MTEPLSLGRFIDIVRRHWILVVAATLLGGVAAYGVAQVIPPTYTATTTLLVKGLPGTGVAANYEAAQFAVSRAKSYPSFIYSLPVLEGVRGDSDRDLSSTELRKDLKATNPTDTPLIVITAIGPSAAEARDMANSAARHLARFITQIETVSGRSPISVETAVQAGLPTEPTSPRTLLIAALGAATGLMIGVLAALVHVYAWRGRAKRRRSRADKLLDWDGDDSEATRGQRNLASPGAAGPQETSGLTKSALPGLDENPDGETAAQEDGEESSSHESAGAAAGDSSSQHQDLGVATEPKEEVLPGVGRPRGKPAPS